MSSQPSPGELLFAEGRLDEAERWFLAAREENPSNAEVLNNLGVVSYARREADQAEAYFLRALEAQPGYAAPIANLADLYMGSRRWPDAARMLERWAGLEPANTTVLNRLAVASLEVGDVARARLAMARSLEADPGQAAVRESLARLAPPAGPAPAAPAREPPPEAAAPGAIAVPPAPTAPPPRAAAAPAMAASTAPAAPAATVPATPRAAPSAAGATSARPPARTFNVLFLQRTPCIRNYKMAVALGRRGHHVTLAYVEKPLSQRYPGLGDDVYEHVLKVRDNRHLWDLAPEFDLVHSHNEPDYFTVAALAAGVPVVHDTHDLVSLRNQTDRGLPFFEGVANRGADGRVYATPGLYEEAKALYDVREPNLVLCNYVSEADWPRDRLPKRSAGDGRLHLVYEGGVSAAGHRNYRDLFLELAAHGVCIHIYPSKYDEVLAQVFAASPTIEYHRPISPKAIIREMTQYDFGIIPFNTEEGNRRFLDTSLANKLFEYLAAGLPVVAADLKSYARYFREHPVGLTYATAADILSAVPRLREMARTTDTTQHVRTFEQEVERLEAFYQDVLIRSPRRRRARPAAPASPTAVDAPAVAASSAATPAAPAAGGPAPAGGVRPVRARPDAAANEVTQRVASLKFPATNEYYEQVSADGYAFLGAARAMLGLEHEGCLGAVRDRRYRLNAERVIHARHSPVRVSADNEYIYTIWSCIEFLRVACDRETIAELMRTVDRIGTYDSGLMRYCTEEIRYVVPNATSAAALLYGWDGRFDRARDLVAALRRTQVDGNWSYVVLDRGEATQREDGFHLAMILYHLRELQRTCGIDCEDLIGSALGTLGDLSGEGLPPCPRGWATPMTYLAACGLDADLAARARAATLGETLDNSNFRVRALAAWALAKGLEYEKSDDGSLPDA